MSEKFEANIATQKRIDIVQILAMFDAIGIKHCNMQVIDNWNYENLQHIKETKNFQIDLLVESEKIVIINGSSNNGTCGAFVSKNNSQYEYDVWFSKELINRLLGNEAAESRELVYDWISEIMLKNFGKDNIIYCAIGVEMFISQNDKLDDKVKNSINVERWILSKD